jgi:hypothetical protein
MSIWLITSVLLADDKTLLGATVAEINETTHALITPVRLMETAEIVAMVKVGKTVKAIWPGEQTDLWWDVQVVPATNGGETVETIAQGNADDRTIAQLWTVEELTAAASPKVNSQLQ